MSRKTTSSPRAPSFRMHSLWIWWINAAIYLSSLSTIQTQAYRMGDVIDTDLWLDRDSSSFSSSLFGLASTTAATTTTTGRGVLRSQMPKFGVANKVDFSYPPDDDEDDNHKQEDEDNKEEAKKKRSPAQGFTLLLEDGLRSLEHVYYKNHHGEYLQSITVLFLYSRNSGMIHSVFLKEKEYGKYSTPVITVRYHWQEEAPVRLLTGHAVLLLLVFVTCILFLLQTCVLEERLEDHDESNDQLRRQPAGRRQAYGGYRGDGGDTKER